jgi:hypothetical protein
VEGGVKFMKIFKGAQTVEVWEPVLYRLDIALGGLMVTVLAMFPKFRGFKSKKHTCCQLFIWRETVNYPSLLKTMELRLLRKIVGDF